MKETLSENGYYNDKIDETRAKIQELKALLNNLSDYADRHNFSNYTVADDIGLRIDQFNELRRM